MATTWIVRKSGTDANGGTSKTVRSTDTDGVTNVGNNHLTSVAAKFVAGDVGHGININSNWRLITAFNSATSVDYSGAPIATGTGRTWTIGGPFLTIAKYAGLLAAGDTAYIGAGTYREAFTWSTAGSAGNVVSTIGDVDGVQTGDPGDVIVSGWLTNDVTAPTNAVSIALAAKGIYTTFKNINFYAGYQIASACISSSSVSDHLTFQNCNFISDGTLSYAVDLIGKVDANTSIIFDSCAVIAALGIRLQYPTSTTADYETGFKVRNCIFVGSTNSITLNPTGASAFKPGGGDISQCSFLFSSAAVRSTSTSWSSLIPTRVLNLYAGLGTTIYPGVIAANPSSIVEDYTLSVAATTAPAGTTLGPNSLGSIAPMIETLEWIATGRAPRAFMEPMVGSSVLGRMPQSTQMAVGIPTVAADDATVGTIAWTNPNNALLFDGNLATNVLLAGTTGHYLKLTGFGFAIPATATITQVRVEYMAKTTVSANAIGNSIKLVKGGTISGNDNVASILALTATLIIYSVGGAADLWGLTLAPSDINAATFGFVISFKDTSGSASTANVEYARIIVNYTDTSSPSEQTSDFAGVTRPAGGSTTIAAGAFERSSTAVQETSTVHTGANAVKLAGPSCQDFQLAVDATSTTITAYMRYDGSYGGSVLPTMQVLNGTQCGVANASTSMVGAANTWEQVTLVIVPTSTGIVTIRFSNLSTAAAGAVYVDTVGVA